MKPSPEVWTSSIQIVKAIVAATCAWAISLYVLDSPIPFLAPWVALLTVQATVFRSLSRGLQTMVASSMGVALSFVIGQYLGVSVATFALALLVGLIGARLRWLRDDGVAIATTSIFILANGFDEDGPMLIDRFIEVGIGVAVGLLINIVLLPPLREHQAAWRVGTVTHRIGTTLNDMAEKLLSSWDIDDSDGWVQATIDLDEELESAWRVVNFARESARLNLRHHMPLAHPRRRVKNRQDGSGSTYEESLARAAEAVSHLRHLARTLRESPEISRVGDPQFREQWASIVHDAGMRISDPDNDIEPVRARLEDLAQQYSDADALTGTLWPVYGSLITSVWHLAAIIDDIDADQ